MLHLGILLTVLVLVFFGMVHAQPNDLTPSRKDILVLTPWLAPIIWEGTFNIDILNEQFRLLNTTIGLTVFAIKKYVVFLKLFLETAEQHFMVGHKVIYYVFTDHPAEVPQVPLGGRTEAGGADRAQLLPLAGCVHAQDGDDQRLL